MANTAITPTIVAKEAIRQLENNCVMGKLVYRGYEEDYAKTYNGWNQGNSINIKAPVYFRVQDGSDITSTTVDLLERNTSITLSYRKNVSWVLSSEEMTYDFDKFSKRFIKPAAQALGNYVDNILLGTYKNFCNQEGTPGTIPNEVYTFLQAQARLSEEAVPTDGRYLVVEPQTQAKMASHLSAMYSTRTVEEAIRKGMIGKEFAGFEEVYVSNNVNTHTNGTWASGLTLTKNGASSEGDTTLAITESGSTSSTAKQGDIFTLATVNSVNPISGDSTGQLRQFVVDSDSTMSSGDFSALQATPGTGPYKIYSSSAGSTYLPYQTVNDVPANGDTVSVDGTTGEQYKVNLGFHKDAIALAMVPLVVPASVNWHAQESYNGYTVRVAKGWDVKTDQEYIRFDILFGVKVLNPFMGCRIAAT